MPLWSKILLIFIIIYLLKHMICDFLQQEHIENNSRGGKLDQDALLKVCHLVLFNPRQPQHQVGVQNIPAQQKTDILDKVFYL